MDASNGEVLYEKQGYTSAYPASTTKIMTAIVALERAEDINEIVTVGDDVESRGSKMNLSRREQIPLIDLLYGLMLISGNDAAKAIAEHIAGSVTDFAQLMNAKARELGMNNTNYVNANGLHKEEHVTTAYDMALLASYAMKNETFRKIVAAESYQAKATNKDSDGYYLENSNRLIHTWATDKAAYKYRYTTGIKTGDTDQAGRCLVASAKKDGVELVLVLFGDFSNKVPDTYRYQTAASFFDWAFANYANLSASSLNLESSFVVALNNPAADDPENGFLTATVDLSGVQINGMKDYLDNVERNAASITATYALNRKLSAPIAEGEVIGTVSYQFEGRTLCMADLVSTRTVSEPDAPDPTVDPSASPLINPDLTTPDNEPGNPWLFWILLIIALLIIIVIVRIIIMRKNRRRNARRRKAYRAPRR